MVSCPNPRAAFRLGFPSAAALLVLALVAAPALCGAAAAGYYLLSLFPSWR